MTCELERIYGSLADSVSGEDEEYIFSSETLPPPLAELQTDRLIIHKGKHFHHKYTNVVIDSLHFYAHKRSYKLLGLLFLAKIFHPNLADVHLRLTQPSSHIREIVFDYHLSPGEFAYVPDYQMRPDRFRYFPQDLERWPLGDPRIPSDYLPLFNLTNANDIIGPHDSDWNARDVVRCAGSSHGSVLFAGVLLNLSRPQEVLNEIKLETDFGWRGVGPGSAEITLNFPGSDEWNAGKLLG